jgi:hypothetical protein
VSESSRAMIELVERGSWLALSEDERATFDAWVATATGRDLALLLRHCQRKWTRSKTSSSQTFAAIRDSGDDE